MDVGELLSLKFDQPQIKRSAEDDISTRPKVKAARLQIKSDSGKAVISKVKPLPTTTTAVEEDVGRMDEEEKQMKMLEKLEQELYGNAGDAMEVLDDQSVKKMILTFEKKVFKNQEMRIKFIDNPEKFMESELDLNDVITEMKVLATLPEHFHFLVELQAINSLLVLINHANSDISIAVIDLLQEITDTDSMLEEEGAEILVDAMMEGQVVTLLVQNLDRMDESVSEEADGVHNTLAVIENIMDLKPDAVESVSQQGLMQWLLKRLKVRKSFTPNKLYCSEILSILLQRSDETRKQLGQLDGIDILLQLLASFKRNDPSSAEEFEYMENLFNCMCSSLLYSNNKVKFLKGEGLQLMNLMLREKKLSRTSALKVLDHAMSGVDGADNCHKFVDILGLRTLFPLFIKPPKKNNKKTGTTIKDHEEHVISIMASLLRNLQGSQRQRLINKFTEHDHAKTERLMEIHFKYFARVENVEIKQKQEKARLETQEDKISAEEEEDFFLEKLEAGLFILQQADYCVAEACASGPPSIKQRVLRILNLHGGTIKSIRNVLKDHAANIGNANDGESTEQEKQRLIALADKF